MRARATNKQLIDRLMEIDADDRYHYPCASVIINSPLALIQLAMETEAHTIAWVLGVECPKSGPTTKRGKKK